MPVRPQRHPPSLDLVACLLAFLSTMPLFTPSPLRALKDAGILEGLFPSGKAPQDLPVTLQVSFDSEIVALGNTLTVQATKHFPTKVDFVGDENRLYTLILQDPTAPSAASPTSRSFLHLIKPNLKPLSPDSLIAVASGGADQEHMSLVEIPEEDLMPWMGPSPGKGSGSHKYGESCSPSPLLSLLPF